LQDADSTVFTVGGAAKTVDVLGVIFVRAVGEVEASDIHPEAEKVAHGGFGIASGPDGADDFGTTKGGRRLARNVLWFLGALFQSFLGRKRNYDLGS
jgi:hypothetical protein